MDVVGYVKDDGNCAFQVFFIRGGLMIGAKGFYLKKNLAGMPPEELTGSFIEMFYAREIIPPDEIVARTRPADSAQLAQWLSGRKKKKVLIITPRRGKKYELLEMAEKNAAELMHVRKASPERKTLEEIKGRLSLDRTPESIGAFDISTMQGAQSVGAFIYWAEGGFRKEFYRHLQIRETREKMDDYAMMEESVGRVLSDFSGPDRPDLILIDGGKGQLEAARRALGRVEDPPEIIALAKDPDRVFTVHSDVPAGLEDGSPSSLLLKRIRDEVHRFAIAYHKKLRGKSMLSSPLENVKGIGRQKRLELLRRFGGLEAIRNAPVEELAGVKGIDMKLAQEIKKVLAEDSEDGSH